MGLTRNLASTALNMLRSRSIPTTVLLMRTSPLHTAIACLSLLSHCMAFCWRVSNCPLCTGKTPCNAACTLFVASACYFSAYYSVVDNLTAHFCCTVSNCPLCIGTSPCKAACKFSGSTVAPVLSQHVAMYGVRDPGAPVTLHARRFAIFRSHVVVTAVT